MNINRLKDEQCDPSEHEYGWKYNMMWDNCGDAMEDFEKLADAYIALDELRTQWAVMDSDKMSIQDLHKYGFPPKLIKRVEKVEKAFDEIEEVLARSHFMALEGPELRKRLHKIIQETKNEQVKKG